MPPLLVRWTRFIIEKVTAMPRERKHLHSLTRQFRNNLKDNKLLGDTHIVPCLVGDSRKCVQWAEQLRGKGIWATAIRQPTVPAGQARIRFSLTAAFTPDQIDEICERILEH